MTKHFQPEQSMGEYHPDERIRARRLRIRLKRDGTASDQAPEAQVDSSSVTVPVATWQEVLRLAKIGQGVDRDTAAQPDVPAQFPASAADPQQELERLIAAEPANLEHHRVAATIAALRRRQRPPNR
jgi:hypothetical protein